MTNREPRLSRSRRALFVFLTLVGIPGLVLGGAELGLRWAGSGYETDFFLDRAIDGEPVVTSNLDFGRRFFFGSLARQPLSYVFATEKPADTFRVAVLGGSAALGDPHTSYSIARFLRAQLEEVTGGPVEALNASMTAINSHVVLPIAEDCLDRDVDLLVIYVGNNEVIGPFGANEHFTLPIVQRPMVRAVLLAKETRLGQTVLGAVERLRAPASASSAWTGLAHIAEQRVAWGAPELEQVYDNYRANLTDLVQRAERHGVPVALCTVGVNLADCSPFGSEALSSDGDSSRRVADASRRVAAARERGDVAETARALEELVTLVPEHAQTRFELGVALEELGQLDDARREYRLARDYDGLRLRADSKLNAIVREVASSNPDACFLVDVESVFDQESSSIVGSDFFWDHVHLTPLANDLIARAVVREAARHGVVPDADLATRVGAERRLAWGEHDRARVTEDMLRRLARPPFTNQTSVASNREVLEASLANAPDDERTARLGRIARECEKVLTDFPEDATIRLRYASYLSELGRTAAAARQWKWVVTNNPFSSAAHHGYATSLLATNQDEAALQAFEKALELNPQSYLTLVALSDYWKERDEPARATEYLLAAVQLHPESFAHHRDLAELYEKLGQRDEAIVHWRAAVAIDDSLFPAWLGLGRALASSDDLDAAREALQRARSIRPQSYRAIVELARLQARRGDVVATRALILEGRELRGEASELDEIEASLSPN